MDVTFQVLIEVKLPMLVFWVVMPYELTDGYRRLGRTYCVCLPTSPHGVKTHKKNININEGERSDLSTGRFAPWQPLHWRSKGRSPERYGHSHRRKKFLISPVQNKTSAIVCSQLRKQLAHLGSSWWLNKPHLSAVRSLGPLLLAGCPSRCLCLRYKTGQQLPEQTHLRIQILTALGHTSSPWGLLWLTGVTPSIPRSSVYKAADIAGAPARSWIKEIDEPYLNLQRSLYNVKT